MTDHRKEAEEYLALARVIDGHGIQMAHHHALMAIAHALLAQTEPPRASGPLTDEENTWARSRATAIQNLLREGQT